MLALGLWEMKASCHKGTWVHAKHEHTTAYVLHAWRLVHADKQEASCVSS